MGWDGMGWEIGWEMGWEMGWEIRAELRLRRTSTPSDLVQVVQRERDLGRVEAALRRRQAAPAGERADRAHPIEELACRAMPRGTSRHESVSYN